jgi:membrane-associated protein
MIGLGRPFDENPLVLFARYGHKKAIVLTRIIPVVRTVLNPLAGVLAVPAGTFTLWQVIGGLVWSIGLTLAGYALASSIPGVDQNLLPAIAVVVLLSLIPIGLELLRARRADGTARPAATDDQSAVLPADPQ